MYKVCVCLVTQSFLTLCNSKVALKAPRSMGLFRQEYWNRLPCPPPGDLLDPRIEPTSPMSPALQADSLPAETLGKMYKLERE